MSRRDFLLRVTCHRGLGADLDPVTTHDAFVRGNVRTAAEALQLRLVRLSPDPGGFGLRLLITPAGALVLQGRLDDAAAEIGRGSTPARIMGPEPCGALGARLAEGSPPLAIGSALARKAAAEVLRGIATGHLRVAGDAIVRSDPRDPSPVTLAARALGAFRLGDRNLAIQRRGAR